MNNKLYYTQYNFMYIILFKMSLQIMIKIMKNN